MSDEKLDETKPVQPDVHPKGEVNQPQPKDAAKDEAPVKDFDAMDVHERKAYKQKLASGGSRPAANEARGQSREVKVSDEELEEQDGAEESNSEHTGLVDSVKKVFKAKKKVSK